LEGSVTMLDLPFLLLIGATALNGITAGASLDQSIKQLPAKHRIGAIAYSAYSRAGDLGNGIAWYASIGISTVLVTIAAAFAAFSQAGDSSYRLPLVAAAVLSILHSVVTSRAAPLLFSQRQVTNDEAALTVIFQRFERLQTLRVFLQVLAFIAVLLAISLYPR
jgi:hypothetical protein